MYCPRDGFTQRWFAWHPVRVNGKMIFLKFIVRVWRVTGYDMDIYGMPYDVGQWEYQ